MGTLTRTQMNSEVQAITDRTSTADVTSIDTRLQWAMDIIGGLYEWRVLRTEDTSTTLETYAITALTVAASGQVTAVGHTFSNGDSVAIIGVSGMTEVNGNTYTVAGVATDIFTISSTSSYTAYTSGGTVTKKTYTIPTTIRGVAMARYVDASAGNAWALELMRPDEFDDKYSFPEGASTGPPYQATQRGGNLIINPLPSSSENGKAIYLNGQSYPTAFTGDSSVTVLDKTLDQAIIYLASSMMFEMTMETQDSTYWKNKSKEVTDDAWATEQAFNEE